MKITIVSALLITVSTIGALGSMLDAARPQPARSVWDGVYSEEQARRGAALYTEWCAVCHGGFMAGGEEAPPLAGGTFLSNWNGVTVGDMLNRTRESMPLDDPGGLSRRQNADILAYMFEFNNVPAGEQDLPRQDGILQQILFELMQP